MRPARRLRTLVMGPAALWLGSLAAAAAADDVSGGGDDVSGAAASAAAAGCSDCDEPPPDFRLLVPPPPVPEYMDEYVQRLHQASGECLLCSWAAANDSDTLTAQEEASAGSSSWIPVLVAVALLSALVGAVVMVVLSRCRRWRVLPSKGLCPPDDSDRHKESPPPPPASKPPDDGSAAGAGGWALPWRRSQRRPAAAPGDRGFGGGPYSIPDQDSVVYAELNSVGAGGRAAAHQPYLLNTYSEIGEPRRLMPDGTYENAGYLVDGPAGGESAGSDPSSAYYSDASGGEPTRLSRRGRLPRAGVGAVGPPPEPAAAAAVRRRLPLATRPGELPLQPEDPRLHAAIVEPLASYDVPAEAAPDAESGPRSGDSGNRSGSEPASPERRRPPRLPLPRLPGRRPRPATKRTSPDRPPPPPPQLYCSEYV